MRNVTIETVQNGWIVRDGDFRRIASGAEEQFRVYSSLLTLLEDLSTLLDSPEGDENPKVMVMAAMPIPVPKDQ